MNVVKIDDNGRFSSLGATGSRHLVIPAGSYAVVVVPIPRKAEESASGWFATKKERNEGTRAVAERSAKKDAVARAKRRRQL